MCRPIGLIWPFVSASSFGCLAASSSTACRDDADMLLLGVRDVVLGRHVGNIKLGPVLRHHGLAEVGILLGDRDARGRGVGTEAITLAASIARDRLGVRKLTAGCYASNIGSSRAFAKAGFAVEGRREAHFILDGHPEDLILMARHLDRP